MDIATAGATHPLPPPPRRVPWRSEQGRAHPSCNVYASSAYGAYTEKGGRADIARPTSVNPTAVSATGLNTGDMWFLLAILWNLLLVAGLLDRDVNDHFNSLLKCTRTFETKLPHNIFFNTPMDVF